MTPRVVRIFCQALRATRDIMQDWQVQLVFEAGPAESGLAIGKKILFF
jgi:hypothetical protein